jgi:hypothetical protein
LEYVQVVLAVSTQLPSVLPELVGQHAWPALPHAHDPAEQVP